MFDPADAPDHICAERGELQPDCGGYYCRIEREDIATAAALAGGETALATADQFDADRDLFDPRCTVHAIRHCTICID